MSFRYRDKPCELNWTDLKRATGETMKRPMLGTTLLGLSTLAMAHSAMQEVDFAVIQGHFAKAEAMTQEVIKADPGNARAHYLYAELLARGGDLRAAAVEVRAARRLDPNITFAEPGNFRSFEAMLNVAEERTQGAKPAAVTLPTPGHAAPGPSVQRR